MVYIGTTNFTQKNRFGSVWTGTMDRKRPVLGGSVRFPQYLGWSWTGCGPRLPVLGARNRTELDLRTLAGTNRANFEICTSPQWVRVRPSTKSSGYCHLPVSTIVVWLFIVVVVCCGCGHPSSLPPCVIIVCLSQSLVCGHCCVLSSMPKVAEGKGVTWQWLGVLWWLFVVAISWCVWTVDDSSGRWQL